MPKPQSDPLSVRFSHSESHPSRANSGPGRQELQTHPLQPGTECEGWRVASPRQARLSDNPHAAPKGTGPWALGGAKGSRESQIHPKLLSMASSWEDGPFLLRVLVFLTSIGCLPCQPSDAPQQTKVHQVWPLAGATQLTTRTLQSWLPFRCLRACEEPPQSCERDPGRKELNLRKFSLHSTKKVRRSHSISQESGVRRRSFSPF